MRVLVYKEVVNVLPYTEDDKTRSNFGKNFFVVVNGTLLKIEKQGFIALLFLIIYPLDLSGTIYVPSASACLSGWV